MGHGTWGPAGSRGSAQAWGQGVSLLEGAALFCLVVLLFCGGVVFSQKTWAMVTSSCPHLPAG